MTVTINGTSGITFPAGGTGNTTGAAVGTTDTQTLTNKTLGSGLVAGASLITSGTSQASTSGTSIDFTGIPSWVKRVTVALQGVSTNGTSPVIVQLGAGSVDTSGYVGSGGFAAPGATYGGAANFSTGFGIGSTSTASYARNGALTVTSMGSNLWVAHGVFGTSSPDTLMLMTGGNKTLSGALDRVRITTVNGTDTFDAGSINILYE